MSRVLSYLACPYSHPDEPIRNSRVELATLVAAKMMQERLAVYSPITHGHAIAEHLPPATTKQHEFWMRHCRAFMEVSSELFLLPMHGWRLSRGVREELDYFHASGRPVTFLDLPRSWNLDKIGTADLAPWKAARLALNMG